MGALKILSRRLIDNVGLVGVGAFVEVVVIIVVPVGETIEDTGVRLPDKLDEKIGVGGNGPLGGG